MRHTIFVAATLALVGVCTSTAQPLSQQYAARLTAPPLYHCRYTDTPPVIDGNISDEVWQRAIAVTQLHDIRGEGCPLPVFTTEIRMLWDNNNFYVCARLDEPYIRATLSRRDDIVWHENDFEVFFDPDGDGVNYFEIEINALGTLLDLQMSHPYRSGGHFFSAWDCPGLQSAVKVFGTLNDSTAHDSCWTLEMAVPHRALAVDFDDALEQGKLWRMNFSRVEWLRDGGPAENWVWAPTGLVNIHMPERWAYVYLAGDPEQSRSPQEPQQPYLEDDYRFLWMLFYAQQDHWQDHSRYIGSIEGFGMTDEDWRLIRRDNSLALAAGLTPQKEAEVGVYATPNGFELSLKRGGRTLLLDHRGHFRVMKE